MPQKPRVSQSRRKMRKAFFTANRGQIRKMMSSRLSKELRSSYGFKTFPIHSGDFVTITTGKFKNKEGKVLSVSRKTRKVTVEGCTNAKASGGSVLYPLDPSNLIIKSLALDEFRIKSLESKKARTESAKQRYAAVVESN
ncbi:ribosomal protein L24 [Vittaforma corneae ATCC 50505]|uniref:Ribosomal protein L24 n=1 Tax=Vittaforma corneae (strain ATCC 50505) TaxID=993615 RepID=L2GJY2_VITCO|nr:ribosomal protein L24 [Vittaforma corneae ATCC 50505]ELA41188.1 ribosomal protein L24 [Vittaforma corneae ATCC 50505]